MIACFSVDVVVVDDFGGVGCDVDVLCTYCMITIIGVKSGREELFVLVMVGTKSLVSELLDQSGSNAE